eukprot:CAMPEP_0202862702 /NCGR_PEP_ID=MMETSP1391-20130828/3651_1 /ASSEMBLY_ACC=CAM_ASM_000867 /TAXON_ID=1034604 /ORGANISM="Chlamydomonas leiostraca, Strain SAG 11-49" /LENGTH=333 /DNA_ID=CAMNT_0049542277 /DNA_START=356 /DNA_END=1357 /DNA_ORIENTATION=+
MHQTPRKPLTPRLGLAQVGSHPWSGWGGTGAGGSVKAVGEAGSDVIVESVARRRQHPLPPRVQLQEFCPALLDGLELVGAQLQQLLHLLAVAQRKQHLDQGLQVISGPHPDAPGDLLLRCWRQLAQYTVARKPCCAREQVQSPLLGLIHGHLLCKTPVYQQQLWVAVRVCGDQQQVVRAHVTVHPTQLMHPVQAGHQWRDRREQLRVGDCAVGAEGGAHRLQQQARPAIQLPRHARDVAAAPCLQRLKHTQLMVTRGVVGCVEYFGSGGLQLVAIPHWQADLVHHRGGTCAKDRLQLQRRAMQHERRRLHLPIIVRGLQHHCTERRQDIAHLF